MKKQLLTLAMLVLLTESYAQNGLLSSMRDEKGIAKQYTAFTAQQQVSFNPKNAAAIIGLNAKSGLVLSSTEKDNLGYTHYRFYQTYAGIPIENTMLIAHVKDGKLVSVSASLITDFNAATESLATAKGIADKDAVTAAIRHVGATSYAWQDADMESALKDQTGDKNSSYYPKATKVWFSTGDDLNPSQLHLAYKVDVYAQEPIASRAYYFVDAKTGAVLGSKELLHTVDAVGTANTLYSGTQTIHSDQTGANAYRLRDYTRGLGIITRLAKNKTEITNTSANWNLALPNQNGLDAHWGVEMTYDYYKANFNRNSLDNNGLALYSYVNKKGILYSDNASWDGTAMNYGIRSNSGGKGVTGIDVTGHELTHGVTQYTCALVYSKESGAMNESLSDIAGKSVQFWAKPSDIDWRLSNDMNWFIRDMSNPNAYSQPDTYKGTLWYTGNSDNGGVHTNSGVGNFMFYLLVHGGSGTNDLGNAYNVSGLGLSEADQIIYRSQTVYLVTTSQYADWRTACINAATDLYGATSNEVTQVKNAWYAVGIGTAGFSGFAANSLKQVITMYPNPVNGTVTSVKFNLEKAGNIVLKVYDRSGNALQSYALGQRQTGDQSYVLSRVNELKTGDYYITIEQDGVLTGRLKFLVVK